MDGTENTATTGEVTRVDAVRAVNRRRAVEIESAESADAVSRASERAAEKTRTPEKSRTPEEITAELAETREHLAATVDAIVERAHPKAVADRTLKRLRAVPVQRWIQLGAGIAGLMAALWGLRQLLRK